jgi:hypothetical protein
MGISSAAQPWVATMNLIGSSKSWYLRTDLPQVVMQFDLDLKRRLFWAISTQMTFAFAIEALSFTPQSLKFFLRQ